MTDEIGLFSAYLCGRIKELSNGSPESKADLARLRRGLGKNPEDSPETWAIVLKGFPRELNKVRTEGSTAYEKAAHMALTVFSMHMQGEDSSVFNKERTFAKALKSIVGEDNIDAVKRRFDALVTSDDVSELGTHLRSLVQIMKSSKRPNGLKPDVSFNYVQLAKDLYFFQIPSTSRNILYAWGRDFYKPVTTKEDLSNDKE